jgi:hypothetical protein
MDMYQSASKFAHVGRLRPAQNRSASDQLSNNYRLFVRLKAGAIVGSVHRGPCADKQGVIGANRTARPGHQRGSSDPMFPLGPLRDVPAKIDLCGHKLSVADGMHLAVAERPPVCAS